MKGNKKPKLKGAQIFFEALRKEGVKHIFGYPGGATLYIYEHLYDIEDIQHILEDMSKVQLIWRKDMQKLQENRELY